jgi:hypothetical protein
VAGGGGRDRRHRARRERRDRRRLAAARDLAPAPGRRTRADYRPLAEQAVEAQARTATDLEQLLPEQWRASASTTERDESDNRQRGG